PDACCPWHVASDSRLGPRRNAESTLRPTPRTFAGGILDTGAASAPRLSCHYVRSPVRPRHIFAVQRRTYTVPVAPRRRLEDGKQRRGPRQGGPETEGNRDDTGRAARWPDQRPRSRPRSRVADWSGPEQAGPGER